MRCLTLLAVSSLLAGFIACSDDDGSDVVPNPPPGSGGGGTGGAPDAGPAAGSGGSTAGTAGAGMAGTGGGGSGGSAGCTPISPPDAGLDAGASDAGGLDPDGGDLDASSGSPTGVVSFEADIHPIFVASCGPCHVADGSAGHNVGGDLPGAYDDAVRLGTILVDRINGGGMPPDYAAPPNDCGAEGRGAQPGDPGCLTVEQVALVQTWIDQCYPR